MKRVGIALVGAGSIAGYHLAALAAIPECSVRLIVSRGRAKAEALAQRFGVGEAGDDIAAALARSDIDAVVVTTPDDTHEEVTIAAAAAGKSILVQKPMATTSAACRRMIAAAESAGVDLQVSFMHRFFEETVLCRDLLAKGAIGEVTSVRLRNATPGPDWADWFFKRERVGGGVVYQLGIHGIDLIDYLIGPIAALGARTATLRPERTLADGRVARVENADSAWATYELGGGGFASHEMSMVEVAGCDRFRMEIYGTKGTMWLRTERGPLALYAPKFLGHDGWSTPALPDTVLGLRQHQAWIDGLIGSAPRAGHGGRRSPQCSGSGGDCAFGGARRLPRSGRSGVSHAETAPA